MPFPANRFRPRRYRPGNLGTWSGHLPFARDLVIAIRPSVLVELGTHYGESYFGFCQSVEESGASCQCYAVDTWQGDPHAGSYGEEVFTDVSAHNSSQYSSFSKLLRTTFDSANSHFGDATVDILHIDGLHTYEQVRHDFETWVGKVRPGGVILLHDTTVRHADFGVWRLWTELQSQYESFEFFHSWGLGVLRIGGPPAPPFLQLLFSGSQTDHDFVRHYYSTQAQILEADYLQQHRFQPTGLWLQAYAPGDDGYTEDRTALAELQPDAWNHVVLTFPNGVGRGRLRLDPVNCPCAIEIAAVRLRRMPDNALLASWTGADEIRSLECAHQLRPISAGTADSGSFLSVGRDPQFLLPELPPAVTEQPLTIEVSLRTSMDLSESLLRGDVEAHRAVVDEVAALRLERDQLITDVAAVRAELIQSQAKQEALASEMRLLQSQALITTTEYRRLASERDSIHAQAEGVRLELRREQELRVDLERQMRNKSAEHERLRLIAEDERRKQQDLLQSYSWKVTAPLRTLWGLVKGGPQSNT